MHLLEKYSFNCGVSPSKLEKPYIYTSYYPVSKEKYIVIHPSSGMSSKNYSYYQEVINFVHDALAKEEFGIVQIGEDKDQKLSKCENLQGKTNLHQTCFIIKNASLLIGNDSFSTHIASAYGVPSISLYSFTPPEVSGPYWKNEKQFAIMPPLMGKKPKYSAEDPERIIDRIKPEEIIKKISLALPEVDFSNLKNLKSILLGPSLARNSLELVPDSVMPNNLFEHMPVNIRFDLLKSNISRENLVFALQALTQRKGGIITSEPLDLNIFKSDSIRQNLSSIIFHIKRQNLLDIEKATGFARKIKESGITFRIALIGSKFSEEEINNLKFAFLDIAPINVLEETSWIDKDTEQDLSKQINDLTIFKSSRIIYSSNKIYLSKTAYYEDKPATSLEQRIAEISNLEELGKELESCYIYNL